MKLTDINQIQRVAIVLVSLTVFTTRANAEINTDIGKAPIEIFQYMNQAEPDFAWKLQETTQLGANKIHRLELTSQRWQNNLWKHNLMVYEPSDVVYKDHVLLFITGGGTDSVGKTPKKDDLSLGVALANFSGACVATLHQVPNQPLMDGKKEDDLISETWLKYLETGDNTWPLLFPMTKSAVKAMDALEQFSQQQFDRPVKGFVVSGASKRGWTSWLTAAVDTRVIGTAPLVIDTLNFPKQMKHQKETWGFYSEQIQDYTSKGLVREDGIARDGRESTLWKMMDPYSYRAQLKMPKLLVVGANDRYWSVDAMNLYWDDLAGVKHIHRVPNAGHGLDGGKDNALRTLGTFFRLSAAGKSLPELKWTPNVTQDEIGITMMSTDAPKAVRLWVARSESNDFRDAKWEPTELTAKDGSFVGSAERTQKDHVAVFGESEYELDGASYQLSTLVFWK